MAFPKLRPQFPHHVRAQRGRIYSFVWLILMKSVRPLSEGQPSVGVSSQAAWQQTVFPGALGGLQRARRRTVGGELGAPARENCVGQRKGFVYWVLCVILNLSEGF